MNANYGQDASKQTKPQAGLGVRAYSLGGKILKVGDRTEPTESLSQAEIFYKIPQPTNSGHAL